MMESGFSEKDEGEKSKPSDGVAIQPGDTVMKESIASSIEISGHTTLTSNPSSQTIGDASGGRTECMSLQANESGPAVAGFPDKKTHGTLTVLYTCPPSQSQVGQASTTYIQSSATFKVDHGETVVLHDKSEDLEQKSVSRHDTSSSCSVADRDSVAETRGLNVAISSYTVSDIQNQNNNNNIDKSGEKCMRVDQSSLLVPANVQAERNKPVFDGQVEASGVHPAVFSSSGKAGEQSQNINTSAGTAQDHRVSSSQVTGGHSDSRQEYSALRSHTECTSSPQIALGTSEMLGESGNFLPADASTATGGTISSDGTSKVLINTFALLHTRFKCQEGTSDKLRDFLKAPTEYQPISPTGNHSLVASTYHPLSVQHDLSSNPLGISGSSNKQAAVQQESTCQTRTTQAVPKSTNKKSRSRSSKCKKPAKAAEEEEEEEDIDFIPVGMLQLIKEKRPQGLDTTNVGMSTSDGIDPLHQVDTDQCDMKESQEDQNSFLHQRLQQQLQQQLHQQQEQQQQQNKMHQRAKPGQEQDMNFSQHARGAQLQLLAQNIRTQQQEIQHGAQQRLLLQLVHQAQQQQKQLLDQTHQAGNEPNKKFVKNQGLIIYHHLPTEQKVPTSFQESDVQAEMMRTKQGEERLKQVYEKSDSEQLGDSQLSTGPQNQESATQVSSNIPKIAEQLLQQSRTDTFTQQSVLEQPAQTSKTELLLLQPQSRPEQMLPQYANSSRAEQATVRPITPTCGSAHQQHPEIARMLNSPVSPRQPASPRQSASPHQSSVSSPCHFVSPRQPYTRQASSPRQSFSVRSASQHSVTVSPQPKHASTHWHPTNPALPSSLTTSDPAQSHMSKFTSADKQQGNFSSCDKQHLSEPADSVLPSVTRVQRLTTGGHLVCQHSNEQQIYGRLVDSTSPLPSASEGELSTHYSQSIPSSQPSQPGQVIHHRPVEQRNIQNRVAVLARSQPSSCIQFPSPQVPSSPVSVPSTQTASTIWQQMPNREAKSPAQSESLLVQPIGLFSSQPVDIQRLAKQHLHSVQPVTVPEISEHKLKDDQSQSVASTNQEGEQFEGMGSLKEKESSLIQSFFAGTSSAESQSKTLPTCREMVAEKSEDNVRNLTVLSYPDMIKNEGGLKVLSEIASERYELAVAGKEEVVWTTEAHTGNSQESVGQTVSNIEKYNATRRKTGKTTANNLDSQSIEEHPPDCMDKLKEKPVKEVSGEASETPRRVVRQRKPKKPFEQEDPPARRPTKVTAANPKGTATGNSYKKVTSSVAAHKKKANAKATEGKPRRDRNEGEGVQEKIFTRSTLDSKEKKTSKSAEESDAESSSRRWSQRLQLREKEKSEKKKTDEEKERVLTRQSGTIDYKEEGNDSVDETPSLRSTRSSRRTSISSDDITTSDIPEKVSIRSQKQDESEEKTTVNTPSQERQPESSKSATNHSRKIPSKILGKTAREKALTTRNKSKRSPSAAKASRAACMTSLRMSTRQAASAEKSSDLGIKGKRAMPVEFVDELPAWRKKMKKSDSLKPGHLKKEEQNQSETSSEANVSETPALLHNSPELQTGPSKQKSFPAPKLAGFQKLEQTVKDSQSQKVDFQTSLAVNRNKSKADIHVLELKKSSVQKEPLHPLEANSLDSETEILSVRPTAQVLADTKFKTESTILSQPSSVIKSTSTLSKSVAESRTAEVSMSALGPELSWKSRSGAASKEGSETQTRATLASERRKMVMYKLVPLVGEDMSDLEVCESLVPVSGYFVPGGSGDRILLPHNLMHGPVTTKISSSTTTTWAISSSPTSSSALSAASASSMEFASSASLSVTSTNVTSSAHNTPYHQAPSSKSTSELPVSTASAYSPLRTALCSTLALTSSSSTSTVSTQISSSAQSSSWNAQLHQPVPTSPSAGEASVGEKYKKLWTTSQPQISPSQYRSSSSWNTTPPSLPSSSSSSSAWNLTTSSTLPPPLQQHQQQQPPSWTTQTALESAWRSSPSVTAAAVESWSKEFLPNTIYSNSLNAEHRPVPARVSSAQQSYHLAAASAQEPETYPSSQEQGVYSTSQQQQQQQDSEFTDARPDSLVHAFLRHVSSNPGGFSQELAGFNLGQQDLAYLENRLRQALSPTTLFSAVAAYEENNGTEGGVSQDTSLQESINLVHTVNLDMEEGNLDSSAHLDLPGIHHKMSVVKSSQPESSTPLTEVKGEGKKVIRERKHQYEIIVSSGIRRFKCLVCGKTLGAATIYRHLRIHDPDHKVSCKLCGKQYTQRHSLDIHRRKFHAQAEALASESLVKRPGEEDMASTSVEPVSSPSGGLTSLSGPLHVQTVSEYVTSSHNEFGKSPIGSLKSPSDAKRQRKTSCSTDLLTSNLDEWEMLKKQATHRQVEEQRRMKAEKKRRKAAGQEARPPVDESLNKTELTAKVGQEQEILDEQSDSFTGKQAESSSINSTVSSNHALETENQDVGVSMTSERQPFLSSRNLTSSDYANSTKPQLHLISPQPVMSTMPHFQMENIPRPIPTASIGPSSHSESDMSDQLTPKASKSKYHPIITENGKFICEICNNQLTSRNGYSLHMRRHSKIKTKFCSYCNKGFHTGQELRSHERTHTGEKPYKCEICYMAFAHSGSYISHRKGHTKRGETAPFPIIDGEIQYPATFKKPKANEGNSEVSEDLQELKKKKRKKKSSDQQEILQQTIVIRRSSLDYQPEESVGSSPRLNLKDASVKTSNLSSSMSDQSTLAGDREGPAYSVTEDNYCSTASVDYYSTSSGYSQDLSQRQFMSPQHGTPSQDYYKQDKYYPRSGSTGPYPVDQQNQQGRAMPVNLALEKAHHYSEAVSQNYLGSVQSTADYYPLHQQQAAHSYQYEAEPNVDVAYQETEDYDNTLAQYKSDPSSSEIVKKLLQHYNVPASTYQDSLPLDYSHQMQGPPNYGPGGPDTTSNTYSSPAPSPSYTTSMSSQQKHYYSPQGSTADYDRSQDQLAVLQSSRDFQEQQPALLLQERQFGSPHRQSYQQQEEGYRSEKQVRTPSSEVYRDVVRTGSQSYPQSYPEVSPSSRDYYPQALPKIESLAKEASGT